MRAERAETRTAMRTTVGAPVRRALLRSCSVPGWADTVPLALDEERLADAGFLLAHCRYG